MIEINDKLDEKLRQQMDGRLEEDEELQLRSVAKAYAICENSIAVLSNLRTNKSHIYYGKTSDLLGFEPVGSYEKIESIWEEKILSRIHPDDQRRRQLQELAFCQFCVLFALGEGVRLAHGEYYAHGRPQRQVYTYTPPHFLLQRQWSARRVLRHLPLQHRNEDQQAGNNEEFAHGRGTAD